MNAKEAIFKKPIMANPKKIDLKLICFVQSGISDHPNREMFMFATIKDTEKKTEYFPQKYLLDNGIHVDIVPKNNGDHVDQALDEIDNLELDISGPSNTLDFATTLKKIYSILCSINSRLNIEIIYDYKDHTEIHEISDNNEFTLIQRRPLTPREIVAFKNDLTTAWNFNA